MRILTSVALLCIFAGSCMAQVHYHMNGGSAISLMNANGAASNSAQEINVNNTDDVQVGESFSWNPVKIEIRDQFGNVVIGVGITEYQTFEDVGTLLSAGRYGLYIENQFGNFVNCATIVKQ
jgi:hypothetical protein